jgi:hypothetical protein
MALIGFNGGLIGSQRSTTFGAASGIWTANEQVVLKRAGSWILDPDANAYITAVQIADGQPLEGAVKEAISSFVVGCKADGIWAAIKASCILAGARTLAGALVPLVGTAPTNFNFVSGDYNRETGLLGNGSTKYLNSNRNNNADPQNSNHNAVFISVAHSLATGGRILSNGAAENGVNSLILFNGSSANGTRNRTTTFQAVTGNVVITNFFAASRSSGSSFDARASGATANYSLASQTPFAGNLTLFQGGGASYSDARLAFYSIGESLDLALLDTRVTTLINAIAAAIP